MTPSSSPRGVRRDPRKSPAAGGWTYVVWPRSAEFFGTAGWSRCAAPSTAAVRELVHGLGDGTHKLPVKAAVRKEIGKAEGDTVHVVIAERL